MKNPTAVGAHLKEKQHTLNEEKTKIITSESGNMRRKIHEGIYIREQEPGMNKNDGFRLPGIYNSILPMAGGATNNRKALPSNALLTTGESLDNGLNRD